MKFAHIRWAAIFLALGILLSACTGLPAGSGISQDMEEKTEESRPSDAIQITGIWNQLNATMISKVCYLDERYAYILAFNWNDVQGENPRCIIGRYDGETQTVTTVFEEYVPNNYPNMSVGAMQTGEIILFTGQALVVFGADGATVEEFILLDEAYRREPAFNLTTQHLAFIHPDTFELYLLNIVSQELTLCFKPNLEPKEGESFAMPYQPVFSPDGSKIAFIKANGPSLMNFETIICCDLQGNVLFETDVLEKISVNIGLAWAGENIIFLQSDEIAAEEKVETFTAISTYDEQGKKVSDDTVIECFIRIARNSQARCQAFSYPDLSSDAMGYSVGILDVEALQAWKVYDTEAVIHTQALSPSGEKLLFIEGDNLKEIVLSDMEFELIKNRKTL